MRYWMVFDIETVPDAEMGRRWLGLSQDVSDREVRERMMAARREETKQQTDFLKPPFHQVVAIAAALIDDLGVIRRLGPVGEEQDSEKVLLQEFFQVIADLSPRLVGWNTSGFDIPALLYRAMRHGLPTPAFYSVGEPYHGYRKRFDEESHLDLMDILSGYGASARVSLHEAALLVGVPGKLDVDGNDVANMFDQGQIGRIRQYCCHDVLTTTLIFMRYAFHRGWLDADGMETLRDSAWKWVSQDNTGVWQPFRQAWTALEQGLA